jgi:hypothetical protein
MSLRNLLLGVLLVVLAAAPAMAQQLPTTGMPSGVVGQVTAGETFGGGYAVSNSGYAFASVGVHKKADVFLAAGAHDGTWAGVGFQMLIKGNEKMSLSVTEFVKFGRFGSMPRFIVGMKANERVRTYVGVTILNEGSKNYFGPAIVQGVSLKLGSEWHVGGEVTMAKDALGASASIKYDVGKFKLSRVQ